MVLGLNVPGTSFQPERAASVFGSVLCTIFVDVITELKGLGVMGTHIGNLNTPFCFVMYLTDPVSGW